jgi:hypothetical protein
MAIFTAQENERLPKSSFFQQLIKTFQLVIGLHHFGRLLLFLAIRQILHPRTPTYPDAHIRCGPQPVVPQQSKQKSKFKNQKPSQTQFKNQPLKKQPQIEGETEKRSFD